MNNTISNALKELNKQTENILLDQLTDLLTRGLLVVESTQPVIIQEQDSNKLRVMQSVRLTLKDKEYILKLETENKYLHEKLKMVETVLTIVKENVDG